MIHSTLKKFARLSAAAAIAFSLAACNESDVSRFLSKLLQSGNEEPPSGPSLPSIPSVPTIVEEAIVLNFRADPGTISGGPAGSMVVQLEWSSPRNLQEFQIFRLGPNETEFNLMQTVNAASGLSSNGTFLVQFQELTQTPHRYFVVSTTTVEENVNGNISIISERSAEVEVSSDDFPPALVAGAPNKPKSAASTPRARKKNKSDFSSLSNSYRLSGQAKVGSTRAKLRFASAPIRTAKSGRSATINLKSDVGGINLKMNPSGRATGSIQFSVPAADFVVEFDGSHRRRGKGVIAKVAGDLLGQPVNGRVRLTPTKSGVRAKAIFLTDGTSISYNLKGKAQKNR